MLVVLTQERGVGSALAQRCLQLLHSLGPWTGNADPSPEAALAGPHDPHHPAPSTRSEDKQDLIYTCPLLHTCHLFCSLSCARGGGRQDSWWKRHDPVFPRSQPCSGSKAMPKICFHIPFPKASRRCGQPLQSFPCGTLVGATVMSQFRLKRNPIGTSLLKATS